MESNKKILFICQDEALSEIVRFCLQDWGYHVDIAPHQIESLVVIKRKEPKVIIIDFSGSHKECLRLCQEIKNDFVTKSVPLIVLIDRRQLRKNLLTLEHGIDDYLLKPPDALDLRVRVEMALRRTQYSFYTNSLTNLPSGRMIEEALRQRLSKKEQLSCAYIDIDNFKYFNDRYGYVKGDRVIIQTAYILHQIMKKSRSHGDFLGHIGGDDFIFITLPGEDKEIALEFMQQFDRLIPLHYSSQDRQRGYITLEDRAQTTRNIPLMSVSIAIVTNKNRKLANIVEINEALAEIKSFLKKTPGSKFMIERRSVHHGIRARNKNAALPRAVGSVKARSVKKPLGQILLERHIITQQVLDQTLDLHWRRDLPFGEVLKDAGVLKEDELVDILSLQARD